jgi:ribonuclease R
MVQTTPAFMIDGPSTVDRDDAIRLEENPDGTRTLIVYVADLTAALDTDPGLLGVALDRGASQYRRQVAVETMLPDDVQAACTLAEDTARPVLEIRLPLDPAGVVGDAVLGRSVLSGAVALSHEQAAFAVADRRHPHHKPLTALREVAEALFRARYGASSAFYDFTRGVFVDEDGALVKVKAAHVVGHLIVQEAMIAANRAVAEWAIREDVPIMFRNHAAAVSAPPAAVHLEDLSAALRSDDPAELATWLARAELTGRRARYDAYPREHHGLGIPAYCHSTSPLRRAADLITQRSIVARLDGRAAPFTVEDVAGFSERLTVVIAEAKSASSTASRERAHEQARQILDQGADYSRMSAARFFALVKRATKEGIASPGFLTEVTRRADTDMFELRDLYHLILLPTGTEWLAAKSACLAQVSRHPEHAVSLVAMWAQTRGVEQPAYSHSAAGPSHRPAFTASGAVAGRDGVQVSGAARTAASKGSAQAQAALSLLAALAGVPDCSTDAAIPIEPASEPKQPTLTGDPLRALNHARNTGLLSRVEWVVQQGAAADGQPLFDAHLTAQRRPGAAVEGRGRAATKKAAKAAAAADLVDRLKTTASNGAN